MIASVAAAADCLFVSVCSMAPNLPHSPLFSRLARTHMDLYYIRASAHGSLMVAQSLHPSSLAHTPCGSCLCLSAFCVSECVSHKAHFGRKAIARARCSFSLSLSLSLFLSLFPFPSPDVAEAKSFHWSALYLKCDKRKTPLLFVTN